jgi:hypothetical protein
MTAPVRIGGSIKGQYQGLGQYLSTQLGRTGTAGGNINAILQRYLSNPTETASSYLPFFQNAAEAAAAPALRDFKSSIAGQAANVAKRWGGNASTTEQRQVNRAGDLFSRNLTESLAQVGPAAVQAGQNYGSQTISAAGMYGNQQAQLAQLILQSIYGQQGQGSSWARIAGTILGGAGGFLMGGPAGSGLGGKIGAGLAGAASGMGG